MNKVLTACLLAATLIALIAATAIGQATQPQTPLYAPIGSSSDNSTLTTLLGALPTLTIPNISQTEAGPSPTLPPFDPSKAIPANMSQVKAEMEANPISDPYHSDALLPK